MNADSREPGMDDAERSWHELLRASRSASSDVGDTARPPDDVIDAYLCGTATEEERAVVLRAAALSAAFRAELIARAEDLAEIESDAARAAFDAAPTPKIPREILERIGSGKRGRPTFGQFLSSLMRRPAFAYGLLLIALSYPAYDLLIARHRLAEGPDSTRIAALQNAQIPALGGNRGGDLAPYQLSIAPGTAQILLSLVVAPEDACGNDCGGTSYKVTVYEGGSTVFGGPATVRGTDLVIDREHRGLVQILVPVTGFVRNREYHVVVDRLPAAKTVFDRRIRFVD